MARHDERGLLRRQDAKLFLSRLVLCSAVLIAGTANPVRSDDRIRFVEPAANGLLIGQTSFRFEVGPGDADVERIDVYVDGVLVGSAVEPEWSFVWDAPSGASGTPVVAVAFAAGQLVARARLQTAAVGFGSEIDVSVVQLYPAVVDRRGRFVRDLEKRDFVIHDQGKPVAIEEFATEATTLSIAVVLDVSASMFDRLGLVQNAACGFVDELRADDEVSVYAFNQSLRQVVKPTRNHDNIKNGIRSLIADGGTALFDALMRVLYDLEEIPGRRAVFLFSDGLDERSVATLARVVEAARSAEAIVYAVGAGDDDRALEARDDLLLLAEETGGDAHFIRKLKELPAVFDAVLSHLRAQYVLSYPPPSGEPGIRQIEVGVTNKKYTVHCRSSYAYKPTESH